MTRLERDVWVAAFSTAVGASAWYPALSAALAVYRLRNPDATLATALQEVEGLFSAKVYAEVRDFEHIYGGLPSP